VLEIHLPPNHFSRDDAIRMARELGCELKVEPGSLVLLVPPDRTLVERLSKAVLEKTTLGHRRVA
jgi:hypothetical protein